MKNFIIRKSSGRDVGVDGRLSTCEIIIHELQRIQVGDRWRIT